MNECKKSGGGDIAMETTVATYNERVIGKDEHTSFISPIDENNVLGRTFDVDAEVESTIKSEDVDLAREDDTVASSDKNDGGESGERTAFIISGDVKKAGVGDTIIGEVHTKDQDHDEDVRTRILHTACIFWTMGVRGWRYGLVGPTFPDLRLLMNEDLAASSWILTAWEFGGLLGAAGSGYLYDRFNKLLLFCILNLVLSISTAVTPWCTQFVWMVVIHSVTGCCLLALGSVCTTDIVHVWFGRSGSYLQAAFLFFSIGAIISPFIAGPFLSTRTYIDIMHSLWHNTTAVSNMSQQAYFDTNKSDTKLLHVLSDGFINGTRTRKLDETGYYYNDDGSINGTETAKSDETGYYYDGDTNIYVPYLISSALTLIASFAFLTLNLANRNVYKVGTSTKRCTTERGISSKEVGDNKTLSIGLQRMFVCLLALFILFFLVCEKIFCGFLTTYLISLGWDKSIASWVNSLYWGCVALGRLSGVFLVRRVSTTSLIFAFVGLSTVGFTGMTISTFLNFDPLIWISVALSGVGMSIIVASAYSWFSENITKISGKQTSFTFVVANIGTMTFPVLTGYMMNNFGYECFVYIVLVSMFFIILVYSVMVLTYKCVERSQTNLSIR